MEFIFVVIPNEVKDSRMRWWVGRDDSKISTQRAQSVSVNSVLSLLLATEDGEARAEGWIPAFAGMTGAQARDGNDRRAATMRDDGRHFHSKVKASEGATHY